MLDLHALQRHNTENSKENIHREGTARSQSQLLHSCFCERFIYSRHRSAYSAAGKLVDRSWEYIDGSQTHECGNWDWGRANSFFWENMNRNIFAECSSSTAWVIYLFLIIFPTGANHTATTNPLAPWQFTTIPQPSLLIGTSSHGPV